MNTTRKQIQEEWKIAADYLEDAVKLIENTKTGNKLKVQIANALVTLARIQNEEVSLLECCQRNLQWMFDQLEWKHRQQTDTPDNIEVELSSEMKEVKELLERL